MSNTEAAQHIPCSTDTITTSCTLCGFTGSPREFANHNCFRNPDDHFDPYDALDTILLTVQYVGRDEGNQLDQGNADTILSQVYALRAYITGIRCAG